MEPNTQRREKPASWPRRVLFLALLALVPVPFFMVVVGGLVPALWILLVSVQGTLVAVPKFTMEGFWMLAILWVHVGILGGLLYACARITAGLLARWLSPSGQWVAVLLVILGLGGASAFSIYREPGHNSAPPANVIRIYGSLSSWIEP